jgi:hypothetical protein
MSGTAEDKGSAPDGREGTGEVRHGRVTLTLTADEASLTLLIVKGHGLAGAKEALTPVTTGDREALARGAELCASVVSKIRAARQPAAGDKGAGTATPNPSHPTAVTWEGSE